MELEKRKLEIEKELLKRDMNKIIEALEGKLSKLESQAAHLRGFIRKIYVESAQV